MTHPKPMMEMTRRYGHTVYSISAFGNPDSASTYEERLLHLIRHEADKLDSNKNYDDISTTKTDNN